MNDCSVSGDWDISDRRSKLARAIGEYLLNFGTIETELYKWQMELSNGKEIEYGDLTRRLESIQKIITESNWDEAKKEKSKLLWGKVKVMARFRNILSHTPIHIDFGKAERTFYFVTANKGGKPKLKLVDFSQITEESIQLAETISALLEMLPKSINFSD